MTKLLNIRAEKKVREISAEEIVLIKNELDSVMHEIKFLSASEARAKLADLKFGSTKNSLLHLAAKFDHIELVRQIIEISDGDLSIIDNRNSNLFTPLHFVAIDGDVEVAKILIAAGANRNPQDRPEKRKWTPIHYAARNGNLGIVEFLTSCSVNIESQTLFGLTPLIVAAEFGHVEIVDFLLKKGAKKNAKTFEENDCMTALHYAVVDEHLVVVEHLLKAGIERDAKTFSDLSALDFAARTNNFQIAILLMSWGVGDLEHALLVAQEARSEKVARAIEKYIAAREIFFDLKWLNDVKSNLISSLKEFNHSNLGEPKLLPNSLVSFNAYGILSLQKEIGFFRKKTQTLSQFYSQNHFQDVVDELSRIEGLL